MKLIINILSSTYLYLVTHVYLPEINKYLILKITVNKKCRRVHFSQLSLKVNHFVKRDLSQDLNKSKSSFSEIAKVYKYKSFEFNRKSIFSTMCVRNKIFSSLLMFY